MSFNGMPMNKSSGITHIPITLGDSKVCKMINRFLWLLLLVCLMTTAKAQLADEVTGKIDNELLVQLDGYADITALLDRINQQNRKDNVAAKQALMNQGIRFIQLSPDAKIEWRNVGSAAMKSLEKQHKYGDKAYNDLMKYLDESKQAGP